MITYDESDKLEAAAKFISIMHDIAGCTATELKRLLHPKIIDGVVAICERRIIEQSSRVEGEK